MRIEQFSNFCQLGSELFLLIILLLSIGSRGMNAPRLWNLGNEHLTVVRIYLSVDLQLRSYSWRPRN